MFAQFGSKMSKKWIIFNNFTLVRDRRQKTFEFLSSLCLLRGGGGQAKSAKNCQFPDESLLFQTGLTTPQ